MKFITISLLIALNIFQTFAKPQQIHLSLGANPTEMVVTFTAKSKCDTSGVRYNRIGGNVFTVNTEVTKFKDNNYHVHIHRAKLVGLQPGLTYEYQCGTDDKWSDKFTFKALPDSTDSPIRVAIYGDLGLDNGVSIPQLKRDVKDGLYDSIFHIGDIAYNLNSDDGNVGDNFMKEIEPIAANVPYQVCPGNHEDKRNFTHYLNRFTMTDANTNTVNNHYYSQDMGSAHFIFFSTELYFFDEYFTESHIRWQYEWLENDLKEANKPENREKRPWIITLGHRPMYCVEDNDKDCFKQQSIIRSGKSGDDLTQKTQYGLEELFHRYGVDIQFYGHKHIYERSYPMYDFNVFRGDSVYDNPKAPIHVISGVGGTTDRPDEKLSLPDWTAFYARDYGYTRMTVQNKTHITVQQFSVENDKIVDSFIVRKDYHKR